MEINSMNEHGGANNPKENIRFKHTHTNNWIALAPRCGISIFAWPSQLPMNPVSMWTSSQQRSDNQVYTVYTSQHAWPYPSLPPTSFSLVISSTFRSRTYLHLSYFHPIPFSPRIGFLAFSTRISIHLCSRRGIAHKPDHPQRSTTPMSGVQTKSLWILRWFVHESMKIQETSWNWRMQWVLCWQLWVSTCLYHL